MITLYDLKDMISFGSYLLSDDRKEAMMGKNLKQVNTADLENWINIKQKEAEDGNNNVSTD